MNPVRHYIGLVLAFSLSSCMDGLGEDLDISYYPYTGRVSVGAYAVSDCNGDGHEDYAWLSRHVGWADSPVDLIVLDGRTGARLSERSIPWSTTNLPRFLGTVSRPSITNLFAGARFDSGLNITLFGMNGDGMERISLHSIVPSATPDDFLLAAAPDDGEHQFVALGRIEDFCRTTRIQVFDIHGGVKAAGSAHRVPGEFYRGILGQFVPGGAMDLCVAASSSNDGSVYRLDGETGILTLVDRDSSGEREEGLSFETLGDIDRDGTDEILICRPSWARTGEERPVSNIMSPWTGRIVWTLKSESKDDEWLGALVDIVNDLNRDGIRDVASWSSVKKAVIILSGADGNRLREIAPPSSGDSRHSGSPADVRACPDAEGDGVTDLLILYRKFLPKEPDTWIPMTGIAVASSRDGRLVFQTEFPTSPDPPSAGR